MLSSWLRVPTDVERVVPHPWEDVTSVVARAAGKIGYEHPRWLLITANEPRWKVFTLALPRLVQQDDYHVLEQQLGLDEERIYSLTLHRFATTLQPPGLLKEAAHNTTGHVAFARPRLRDDSIKTYCLALDRTKICPACLSEGSYHRLYWRMRMVLLCPRHRVLLRDRCPRCQAAIPTLRNELIRCPNCGHNSYTDRPWIHVSISWFYDCQTLYLHFLTGEDTAEWYPAAAFTESPLLRLQPWQYFSLLEKFQQLLGSLSQDYVLFHALEHLGTALGTLIPGSVTVASPLGSMLLFHVLFASWPEHVLLLSDLLMRMQPLDARSATMFEPFENTDQIRHVLLASLCHPGDHFQRLERLLELLFLRFAYASADQGHNVR